MNTRHLTFNGSRLTCRIPVLRCGKASNDIISVYLRKENECCIVAYEFLIWSGNNLSEGC